ncbi:cytosolic Fe-S cluster assembly factor NUBP2 homolog [Galendromus occidentalis]|uniref:Cytosolic Fe-S cluster assembly factor NUBP2 homolog n=1 Tax=Galendromus occidentalis TaxID=34638 RepID=A0AAJ6QX70_9ACAR|nr:cytosolic Fe-S cluster assembly factor NUBP2 homolog [Galendromus occidentalis]
MDGDRQQGTSSVKSVLLVMSGKGGVGKSTVSVQLARNLVSAGHRVGLLDIDLCGPSIPKILGINGMRITQAAGSDAWLPCEVDGLKVMSIGFLLGNEDSAVVWRGPKKQAMISQFVNDVAWGQLDYLVVDTPPGTSDEHMAIVECLKRKACKTATVLVSTPQNVSLMDVQRQVAFCKLAGVQVLGLVENMSVFKCPCCNVESYPFCGGGGEQLARHCNIPLLGSLPINLKLAQACDDGKALERSGEDETTEIFQKIVQQIVPGLMA